MSVALFVIYCVVAYLIFSSFTALAWFLKVLNNEPEAYKTERVSQCWYCDQFEYTELVSHVSLCWDCANSVYVPAWEEVSIWE